MAYILLFSWLSITRHYSFHTDAYDVGNVNQAFWNTVHGRPLYFTNWRGVELTLATDSRLAMHVEPIYFLIAPIYWLWQRPETFLIVQTVILALGAWPVYWLARDALKSQLAGVLFALVYLLFPGLQAANLWEFHAVALAAPLLLYAFYFGYTGRWWLMWVFAIMAMGTKEEIPLTVMLIGLYFTVTGIWRIRTGGKTNGIAFSWRRVLKQPQVINGLSLAVIAAIWFVVAVFVIIPSYEGDASPYLSYYTDLISNSANASGVSANDPVDTAKTIFSGRNLNYLFDLYTPVAFLSLLNPLTAAFSLPDMAINLLSDHEPMHFVQKYHYTAPMIPGIIISAILGLAWLARVLSSAIRINRRYMVMLLSLVVFACTLSYHFYHGYTPLARAYEGYSVTSHDQLGETIAQQIPPDASVSAQRYLNPHVSSRKTLYRFPYIGNAEYVFLDLATLANEGNHYEITRELLNGDEFGLVRAEDGYLLLQRGVVDSVEINDTFYDFVRVQLDETTRQPQYPVNVVFDDALQLVGFDVYDGRHTEMPQTPLRFTLYWRVLKPIAENYQFGLYLLDEQRQLIGGPDFGKEPGIAPTWFPTSRWKVGETIKMEIENMPWWTAQYDEYGVSLGVLQGDDPWNISTRLQPTTYEGAARTPLADDGTLVELMTFKTDIGGMPERIESWWNSEVPSRTIRQSASWENGIQMLGYRLPHNAVRTGENLSVTLYWQTHEPFSTDYKVFAQLIGEDGRLYAQHDAQPHIGGFPTSQWRVGEVMPDKHVLEIGEDVPRGNYVIYIGFYDPNSGERLLLEGGRDFITLDSPILIK